MQETSETLRPPVWKRHPWLFWLGIPLSVIAVVLIAVFEVLLHRAEPILRARVVDTLSARFNSRVELKGLDVSLVRGFEVSGKGLAIYPYNLDTSKPTFSVEGFSFRTAYGNLLRTPMVINRVQVHGLHINLPPKSQRKQLPSINGEENPNGDTRRIKIQVKEFYSNNALLTLETDKPGRVPMEIRIHHLTLKSTGAGKPLNFVATLVNPKPIGDIQSSGAFGPWNSDDPGQTAVAGNYSFRNANLGTLKGIGGILSSTGHYQGALERIVVDGQTDTPDFRVNVSGHKVPLHTDFHAIVDGTNGDTYLQPVVAHFLGSAFTANGYVVRNPAVPGHDIILDVDMDRARVQDLLVLGVRTTPPVMTGQIKMHTKLELPAGPQDVAYKLRLRGNFDIVNAHFSNQKVQSKVDELSLRSQGQSGLAKQESKDPQTANVASDMQGNFTLGGGALSLSNLHYKVPGALIKLDGTYTLDGNKFDFYGTANLDASVSRLVGGWKGMLLTPLDPFFRKNGSGTEVPIKISGTRSEPRFGLNFKHDDPLEKKRKEQREARSNAK
ncbi:MAG TPA: AsmA-like C-terminal region-containing protein [Acidobacteriaceae bacterium]|nr:AsmA-like C-terminal region-containing protein [Acidobacteriaceae bacterium]